MPLIPISLQTNFNLLLAQGNPYLLFTGTTRMTGSLSSRDTTKVSQPNNQPHNPRVSLEPVPPDYDGTNNE